MCLQPYGYLRNNISLYLPRTALTAINFLLVYGTWNSKHSMGNICLTARNKCLFYDFLMLHRVIKSNFANSCTLSLSQHVSFFFVLHIWHIQCMTLYLIGSYHMITQCRLGCAYIRSCDVSHTSFLGCAVCKLPIAVMFICT